MPSEMMQPKGLSSSSFFSDKDVCFPNEVVISSSNYEVYEILQKLLHRFHWIVPGYIMGGENRSNEKARLRKDFKQSKDLKKTDGTKRQRITGITKLEDANDVGGKSSDKCTLLSLTILSSCHY
ncbi:DEAD-box ATP-dependent RNA helicase 17 [Camellia lanceoleosa]|uniref:DEAD-box ATP-dependent RNA helicase 17 n=1 Tax=Camellia lanceoleosa TaxID=1840588 RepID=A0ACC0GGN4_9ERIC|nr:DEAD-box ATP-dependent RNA helicase 17 [Camellia lanceoleosa]